MALDLSAGLIPAQTPAGSPPPVQPAGAIDLSAGLNVAQNAAPSPPQRQKTFLERASDDLTGANEPDEQWKSPVLGGMLAGALKSASNLVGNILDLSGRMTPKDEKTGVDKMWADTYRAQNPNASDDEVTKAYQDTAGGRINQHVSDAAGWLKSGGQPQGFWQNVGAAGEQMLELLGSDGMIKLAGGAVEAGEAGEHLNQAQQLAKALKLNPKVAGLVAIGLKASKDAAVLGGQTYLHTEDPRAAAWSAGVGGAVGAVPGTASAAAGGAKSLLRRVLPRTVQIGEESIPALAEQVDEAGNPTGVGARGAPDIAAQQQKGGAAVIRNSAQDATERILNRVNETRPQAASAAAGYPQLPAPADSNPFRFELGTTKPTEAAEGDLLHPAQKGVRLPGNRQTYTAESAPAVAEGTAPRNQGTMGADITTEPERPTSERPVRGDTVSGGGALQTTDPREASRWQYQLGELIDSPEFEKLSPAEQQEARDGYDQLGKQLGLYYSSPYAGRFGAVDVASHLANVGDFGQAANEVQTAVQPVYQKLDQVSGGEFNKWKLQARNANKVIRNATSSEAVDNAQAKLDEANDAIDKIITRHAGDIGPQDYRAAKSAWRDSTTLSGIHNVIERMANGVTLEESERGLPRVITGNAKMLENWLAKGTNRARATELIGQEGIDNLKKMSLLLSKANTARSTTSVMRHVWEAYGHMHAGAFAGGIAGELLGGHWGEGAALGGTAGLAAYGARQVLREAAVNPRVGSMLEYAATHDLDPKDYAEPIARLMQGAAGGEGEQEQEQPEENPFGEQQ